MEAHSKTMESASYVSVFRDRTLVWRPCGVLPMAHCGVCRKLRQRSRDFELRRERWIEPREMAAVCCLLTRLINFNCMIFWILMRYSGWAVSLLPLVIISQFFYKRVTYQGNGLATALIVSPHTTSQCSSIFSYFIPLHLHYRAGLAHMDGSCYWWNTDHHVRTFCVVIQFELCFGCRCFP